MPIVTGLRADLPVIGHIKLGTLGAERPNKGDTGKKHRLPVRLDHFLITTSQRGEDGILVPDDELNVALTEFNGGKAVRRIPIVLLFDDPDLNFRTEYSWWADAKCMCAGDGERAIWYGPDGNGGMKVREGDGWKVVPGDGPRDEPCSCKRLESGICKPHGVLRCIIPLKPTLGGVFEFRTTSWMSVAGILNSQRFIQAACAGHLAYLPLELVIRGVRVEKGVVWVAHVEFSGTRQKLIAAALEERKLLADGLRSLAKTTAALSNSSPHDVSPDEARDITDEFAPGSTTEDEAVIPLGDRLRIEDERHDDDPPAPRLVDGKCTACQAPDAAIIELDEVICSSCGVTLEAEPSVRAALEAATKRKTSAITVAPPLRARTPEPEPGPHDVRYCIDCDSKGTPDGCPSCGKRGGTPAPASRPAPEDVNAPFDPLDTGTTAPKTSAPAKPTTPTPRVHTPATAAPRTTPDASVKTTTTTPGQKRFGF